MLIKNTCYYPYTFILRADTHQSITVPKPRKPVPYIHSNPPVKLNSLSRIDTHNLLKPAESISTCARYVRVLEIDRNRCQIGIFK
jgi:hypothetical protein